MNVIPVFAASSAFAAARVRSYVILVYAASSMPADETPRQKKQASNPARRDCIAE